MGVVVPLGEEREKGQSAVQALAGLVEADFAEVNAIIAREMASPVELIPEISGYLIHSGGKRLRPMLTLAAAKMCGYDGVAHRQLAAAVEFIHTATLLHDDVVDESELRRGKPTANHAWGNKPPVLVGDFLFSRAFQLMVATGDLKVLAILSEAAAIIAEGEVMQLATTSNTGTTEDAYLKVISAKTAALFAAATRVGAVIAGRPSAEEEALLSYGRNLGIAFQLVDDALDYSGREARMGKSVGDDFRERKITLPVVLAFRRGSEAERDFWRRTLEKGEQTPEDLGEAVRLMEAHGAIADTILRAQHYGAIARDALAIFPAGKHREALLDIVDFCIDRAH